MFLLEDLFSKFAVIKKRDSRMLSLKRIKETDNTEYKFIENLLTSSFPTDEYRNLEEQRDNTRNNKFFNLMIVTDNETPIGFISFWDFEDFRYVEHLAISPTKRNKGYGNTIIKKLQEEKECIILEAELPDDELSKRRIAFYKNLNFGIFNNKYIQPAYKKESKELEMHLLYWKKENKEPDFEKVKNIIYKYVYNL